jgi:hypothetical protein
MIMKKALVTICIGDDFNNLSEITHPSIQAYSDKIGADFIVINECMTTPHWEKLSIYELFNTYDRIIYMDTDMIVRDDCPDLFEEVPYNKIGAFNEAKFVPREYALLETAKVYDIDTSKINWNGKYYNTGLMVISKCHKKMFTRPEIEHCNFYEQSFINLKIALNGDGYQMYDLSYKFNRMTCLDFSGEDRHASYIIHYAGYHYFKDMSFIKSLIKEDLMKWSSGTYDYKRHILVVVSGGLGDQVDAEPTVRFIKKMYEGDDIIITSHFPRLFKDIGLTSLRHDNFTARNDTPYYRINTFPDPTTVTYSVVSNLMIHTVDYCAIASLNRTLPLEDKVMKLSTSKEDDDELDKVLNGFDLTKAVLIHPGRHWNSKSFPREWWQEVADKISAKVPVCLIGTDDNDNRGAYQLDLPDNSINLIDRTSVGSLISAISRSPILLSNDSSPIHLAGSFDNWIVAIPTCKHPDHILPFRKCPDGKISNYHKAVALYKKLTFDDCDQRPSTWIDGGSSAEEKVHEWIVYLPDIDDVCESVLNKWESSRG